MVVCALIRLSLRPDAHEASVLRRAAAATRTRLYVLLRGNWRPLSPTQAQDRLSSVYDSLTLSHPRLDVRVLLPPALGTGSVAGPAAAVAAAHANVVASAPELEALLGVRLEDGADLAELNAGVPTG